MATARTTKRRWETLDPRTPAAERNLMDVDPQVYSEFLKRLDRPARPNERLRRTMHSKAPWLR
ncbi:MAG: DUF1778 domain-containing protein [Burkholderiaceae bacterium]|nr:DUF1778 domain-containing protein [Burkholderiaceae bacterium]